jgi:signal transduction histidine kinase
MSVFKGHRYAWVALTALSGVAFFASVSGLFTTYAADAAQWIAAMALLGVMILLVIGARSGNITTRESDVERQTARSDLSAHLLTIQEEERKNLSRELHDGVGQMITALKMELARMKVVDTLDGARLDRARDLADEILRTIRNISLLLRPTALDDLGLEAALQWHAEDFSRRTSVGCQLSCSLISGESIPESAKTCIYRIVQEALNNCEKHAAASKVTIEVHQSSEGIAVSVTDNGRGIPPDFANGLGILGMRERAHMLGGHLEVTSEAGLGTKVSLLVPGRFSYLSDRSRVVS